MKIAPFPRRKRSARKPRTHYHTNFSSFSSGINGYSQGFAGAGSHDQHYVGCRIVKYHLPVTVICVYEKKKYALVAEESKLLNPSFQFPCFPRGPRSKAKAASKHIEMNNHIADTQIHGEGVSAEENINECPCPKSLKPRTRAQRKGRKRKTKAKDEESDSEVTVSRQIHFRGRARRVPNNTSTITNERGKLDSAMFLHYFMHIWSTFPEEKLKSSTYLDPLWFDLYSNEKNRPMVLKWIKEKGVFSKKYVFVPIVMWSHWSLLIFCHLGETRNHSKTNAPCMLLLDSLHAIGPTRLEPLIRRLLIDIYKSEERLETKEQLKKIPLLIPKVPQQKKGEECGFYILYFIKLFLESAPDSFDSESYPYFMRKDWFTVEDIESFCKTLDAFALVESDHNDCGSADSSDSVEFIESSLFDERACKGQ